MVLEDALESEGASGGSYRCDAIRYVMCIVLPYANLTRDLSLPTQRASQARLRTFPKTIRLLLRHRGCSAGWLGRKC